MVELIVDYVRGGRQDLGFAGDNWLARRVTPICRNPRHKRDHYFGELWTCPACKPEQMKALDMEDGGSGCGVAYAVVIRGDSDGCQ